MTTVDEITSPLPAAYLLSVQVLRNGLWTEVERHVVAASALDELGSSAVGLGVDVGVWVRVELLHADEVVGRKEFRSTAPAVAAVPDDERFTLVLWHMVDGTRVELERESADRYVLDELEIGEDNMWGLPRGATLRAALLDGTGKEIAGAVLPVGATLDGPAVKPALPVPLRVGDLVEITGGPEEGSRATVVTAPEVVYADDPGPRVSVEIRTESWFTTTPLVTDVRRIEEPVNGPVAVDSATRRRARLLVEISSRHTQAPGKLECRCGSPYPMPAAPDAPRLHAAEQVLIAIGSWETTVDPRPEPSAATSAVMAHRHVATRRELEDAVADLAALVLAQDDELRASAIGYDTLADIHDDHVAELRAHVEKLDAAAGQRTADVVAIDVLRELVTNLQAQLRHRNWEYGRASATIGDQRAVLALLRERRDQLDTAVRTAHQEIAAARVLVRAALGEADAVDLGAVPLVDLVARLYDQVVDHPLVVRRLAEWLSQNSYLGDVHQAAAAAWSYAVDSSDPAFAVDPAAHTTASALVGAGDDRG